MRGLTPTEVMVLEDSLTGSTPYLATGSVQTTVHELRAAGRIELVEAPNRWGPTVRKVVPTAAGRVALMIHRFMQVTV